MPITELNHYLLVAKDLERTRDFYQKVLGLEIAERPDFGFPGYWLKTGENICVHLASQEPNKTREHVPAEEASQRDQRLRLVDHIAFLAKDPTMCASASRRTRSRCTSAAFRTRSCSRSSSGIPTT